MDDATCIQLFIRDLGHELTHIYLKDEGLMDFFKTVEIRDLEGIKTYIKENGSSVVLNSDDYLENLTMLASGENNLHESGEINQKKSKEKSHYQF